MFAVNLLEILFDWVQDFFVATAIIAKFDYYYWDTETTLLVLQLTRGHISSFVCRIEEEKEMGIGQKITNDCSCARMHVTKIIIIIRICSVWIHTVYVGRTG